MEEKIKFYDKAMSLVKEGEEYVKELIGKYGDGFRKFINDNSSCVEVTRDGDGYAFKYKDSYLMFLDDIDGIEQHYRFCKGLCGDGKKKAYKVSLFYHTHIEIVVLAGNEEEAKDKARTEVSLDKYDDDLLSMLTLDDINAEEV